MRKLHDILLMLAEARCEGARITISLDGRDHDLLMDLSVYSPGSNGQRRTSVSAIVPRASIDRCYFDMAEAELERMAKRLIVADDR